MICPPTSFTCASPQPYAGTTLAQGPNLFALAITVFLGTIALAVVAYVIFRIAVFVIHDRAWRPGNSGMPWRP